MSTIYNWGIWVVLCLPIAGIGCSYFAIRERRAAGTMVFFMGATSLGADLLLLYRLLHHTLAGYTGTFTFWSFSLPDGGFQGIFPANLDVEIGLQMTILSLGMLALLSSVIWLGSWQAVRILRSSEGLQTTFLFVTLISWGGLCGIMSGNLFLSTIMWGVSGLGMWLLIGQLWQRIENRSASTLVALTNRLSDAFMLCALVVWFLRLGTYASIRANTLNQPSLNTFSFAGLSSSWIRIAHGLTPGIGDKTLWIISASVMLAVLLRLASMPWMYRIVAIAEAPVPLVGVILAAVAAPSMMLMDRLVLLFSATPHFSPVLLAVVVVSALAAAAVAWLVDDVVVSLVYIVTAIALLAPAALAAGSTVAALIVTASVVVVVIPLSSTLSHVVSRFITRDLSEISGVITFSPLLGASFVAVAVVLTGLSGWPLGVLSAVSHPLAGTQAPIPAWERALAVVAVVLTLAISASRAAVVIWEMCASAPKKRRGFEPSKMRAVGKRELQLSLASGAPIALLVVLGYPWADAAATHVLHLPHGEVIAPVTATAAIAALLGIAAAAVVFWKWIQPGAAPGAAAPADTRAWQRTWGTRIFQQGWGFRMVWDRVMEQYPTRFGEVVDEADRTVFAPLFDELTLGIHAVGHALERRRRQIEHSTLVVPVTGFVVAVAVGLVIWLVNVGQW